MNNSELVQSYRQQIGNVVNQANLQLFWNMYNRCGHGAGLHGPQGSFSWGPLATTTPERGSRHTPAVCRALHSQCRRSSPIPTA